MNKSVAISIIIPVYNEQRTLERCLDSIYAQSIKNIEILCCDDGSTDKTLDILQEYAERYDNIKIFRQKNQGAGAARNLCLDNVSGNFICFMDADDYYIDSNALQMLYEAAVEQGLNVACGFLQENNLTGNIEKMPQFRQFTEKESRVVTFREYQNDSYFQCYLFKSDFIQREGIRFPLFRRFQDPIFLANCLHAAKKYVIVPVEFYFHQRDDQKITYDRIRANDLAKGLRCQLQFAIEHDYSDLKNKMRNRINKYYREYLIQNMTPDNYELLNILLEINNMLDKEHYVVDALEYFVLGEAQESYELRKINYLFRNSPPSKRNIIVYGAGNIGKKSIQSLYDTDQINIIAWVDKNKGGTEWQGHSIVSVEKINELDFDYILIAIERLNVVREVYTQLQEKGIAADRILCWRPMS